jgi:hypothetical protein
MTRRSRGTRAAVVAALLPLAALVGSGCARTLAFGTATKFALDISQKADQTIDVSMGYDRAEIAAIPAPPGHATEAGEDTYSVLGTFYVTYGNPWLDEPVRLNQFFATGMAAKKAAQSERFRRFFGQSAGVIDKKKEEQP